MREGLEELPRQNIVNISIKSTQVLRPLCLQRRLLKYDSLICEKQIAEGVNILTHDDPASILWRRPMSNHNRVIILDDDNGDSNENNGGDDDDKDDDLMMMMN